MNRAGPLYCIAVTVWSSRAMSTSAITWAAASRVQSSVTASAGLSAPAAISSASAAKPSASARHACPAAALSSGTRSS